MIKIKNGIGIKCLTIGRLEFLWVSSVRPEYCFSRYDKALIFGRSSVRWLDKETN